MMDKPRRPVPRITIGPHGGDLKAQRKAMWERWVKEALEEG